MNEEAQRFRSITMKVLVMQLNSISIMDLVAYGGAALGIIFSLLSYYDNKIDLGQTFMMIMLSAEFFIPLRLLGSFFHIAMNGNAASEKIFKLLDTPVIDNKTLALGKINEIELSNLTFAYKQDNVLENINLKINEPGIYGVVGSSGSGKSTIAKLLLGYFDHYQGSLTYNGLQVKEINHHDLMKQITLVEHNPYIFAGTVRSNLLDGNCYASDEQLMAVLEKVNLLNYFKELDGLDSEIEERGNNLSGGQKQRLSIARALLHDSGVYIFDEATSNIDVESENDLMKLVDEMKDEKTILLISHRLMNVVKSDRIYVMEKSRIIENGTHEELLANSEFYRGLYLSQQKGANL